MLAGLVSSIVALTSSVAFFLSLATSDSSSLKTITSFSLISVLAFFLALPILTLTLAAASSLPPVSLPSVDEVDALRFFDSSSPFFTSVSILAKAEFRSILPNGSLICFIFFADESGVEEDILADNELVTNI